VAAGALIMMQAGQVQQMFQQDQLVYMLYA
jgi:hypothetical protein